MQCDPPHLHILNVDAMWSNVDVLWSNVDLSNKLIGNDNQVFTYAVDLNMTHHPMFVYSDVADYTYVGNITAPILRIVSYKQSKSI